MKVGDLVRVKNINDYWPEQGHQPGFLLQIIENAADGYYIVVMSGPYLGAEHWISGKDLEIVNESR